MNYRSMTSSDIWNLFNSGKLDLNGLGKEDLDAIYEVEMEELERDSDHDMSLMEECTRLLLRSNDDDVKIREFTIDDIEKIENDVLSREKSTGAVTKRHIPKRRLIPLVAAIVVIMAVFTVVVAAKFDWLGDFGLTIRDLLNMGGSIVTNEKGEELYISKNTTHYESFDELTQALGFKVLQPSADSGYNIARIFMDTDFEVSSLKIAEFADFKTVDCRLELDGTVITYCVYYDDENADHALERQNIPENLETSYEWNGYTVYYFYYTENSTYIAHIYDAELAYTFTSDTLEHMQEFIASLE